MTIEWWTHVPKYQSVPSKNWTNWHWQMQNRIRSIKDLVENIPDLVNIFNEQELKKVCQVFPIMLTPFTVALFANLMKEKKQKPWLIGFLKILIPSADELNFHPYELTKEDPVGELPTARGIQVLSRFYPDRVLVHTGTECPVYCRYCFRRDRIFPLTDTKLSQIKSIISEKNWKEALNYILQSPPRENNPGTDPPIREVIFSGGEPLILSDQRIERMLQDLRQIPHVRIIRFDTKMISVNPYRITPEFLKILHNYHPIYMNIHFVHPYELHADVRKACEQLADAGVVLGAHVPLLRGINDDVDILKELFLNLIEIRVRPYYLIHFIPTKYTNHFRTSIEKGKEIVKHLWGYISGLANPIYIIYLPKAKGKVMHMPDYLLAKTPEGYWFENFEGDIGFYPLQT